MIRHSPDIYAPTDKLGEIAQTIMVVGISNMAQALILRFARLGVYSPNGKLRLLWVGKGVAETLTKMAESFPALKPGDHTDSHWGRQAEQSKEFMDLVISPLAIITLENTADAAVRNKQVAATAPGLREFR